MSAGPEQLHPCPRTSCKFDKCKIKTSERREAALNAGIFDKAALTLSETVQPLSRVLSTFIELAAEATLSCA